MKYLYALFCAALLLDSALAQPLAPKTPLAPLGKPKQTAPDAEVDYWAEINQRLETENKKYAEEHPDWPKGEPSPPHIAKNALTGITGKNLLEGVRNGVKLTREAYKDAPEQETRLQIELAIEKLIAFFPLIETNPQGYTNLHYIISSINSDPAYRCYLIDRSYPSDLPDTLFSLYEQDKFKENLQEILGRYKTIMISPNDDTAVQKAAIAAYKSLVYHDVTDTLMGDREVQRLAEKDSVEITPSILKQTPAPRVSVESTEHINATLLILDGVLLDLQGQFKEESTRPEWLKNIMLDFIQDSVKQYTLTSAQKHLDFLKAQGRNTEPAPEQ